MYSCLLADHVETSIASAPAVFPPEGGVPEKKKEMITYLSRKPHFGILETCSIVDLKAN